MISPKYVKNGIHKMKGHIKVLIAVAITALATAFFYETASILIFKIREPHFCWPLRATNGTIEIRNDPMGGGNFGDKRSNGRTHSGIDIKASIGTPVYAARSGLAFRGKVPTGYGKYVMIYHADGFISFYGHLSEWAVESGKKVRRGQLIGYVGKTGNAAGKRIEPHLHFEIRKGAEPMDPKSLVK